MVKIGNRVVGLYVIVVFKILKGSLLLALALGVYSLLGGDLSQNFDRLLRVVRIDPEKQFFEDLAAQLVLVAPATLGWVATGTLITVSSP